MRLSRISLAVTPPPFKVSSNIALLAPKRVPRDKTKPTVNASTPSTEEILRQRAQPVKAQKKQSTGIVPFVGQTQEDKEEILARRWVRNPNETCVLKVPRVSDILPNYIAYYKFADYTWRPILLLPAGDPVALETRTRHIAYELRHLSEFGHALWVTEKTRHSVYYPHGIIERSYVECTYYKGNRQRLQCFVRHEGLVDGRDPASKRALIAVSMIWTLSCPEDRWQMLICRSRRTGAMSAGLSALRLRLMPPELVGKRDINESFMLEPHTTVVGNGLSARCIASCWNICKHPHLYVHPMEVPAAVGLDSVMQAIHYTALTTNRLIQRGEKMVCLAFSVETAHPFPPIEAELPYTVALSSPTVFSPKDMTWGETAGVGQPLVEGGPIQRYSASITVGFAQYIDHRQEVSIERAHQWWAQKDETPYRVTMYTTRDAHLRKFHVTDTTTRNPFDAKNPYNTPNSQTISRQRLRDAMWRRIEEMGADPEADIDGDGLRLQGEVREDAVPYLLTSAQDKAPEDPNNRQDCIGKIRQKEMLEPIKVKSLGQARKLLGMKQPPKVRRKATNQKSGEKKASLKLKAKQTSKASRKTPEKKKSRPTK